jgi:hypothetical protein
MIRWSYAEFCESYPGGYLDQYQHRPPLTARYRIGGSGARIVAERGVDGALDVRVDVDVVVVVRAPE